MLATIEIPRIIKFQCQKCGNDRSSLEKHDMGYCLNCITCGTTYELDKNMKPYNGYEQKLLSNIDKKTNLPEYPWGIAVTVIDLYLVDRSVNLTHCKQVISGNVTYIKAYIYHIPTFAPLYKWKNDVIESASTNKKYIYAVELDPWMSDINTYNSSAYSAFRELIKNKCSQKLGVEVKSPKHWNFLPLGELKNGK